MRNNCHLAADFGTNLRVVFFGGIGLFPYSWGVVGSVKFSSVSLLSATSSYADDIAHTEN